MMDRLGDVVDLTLQTLLEEAKTFAVVISEMRETALFGVTDGKAVGTYLEGQFIAYLAERYRWKCRERD